MDFATLKQQYDARTSGVPEEFSDRIKTEPQDVVCTFTNDQPAVVIRKPKNEKNKATGGYDRVMTKDGRPVFQDVLYLPAVNENGEKLIIVTAMEDNVRLVKSMIGDAPGEVIKNADVPDKAWTRYDMGETIDGKLKFVPTPKMYKNGKTYMVPVLAAAE